jgi:DNA-binding NarL/FixJ family response regulator
LKRPTIVLADDHAIVVDGLRRILEPDYDLVATAANGRDLVEQVLRHKPAVVVVDISMPELNGLDAMRQALREGYAGKFVFLTGNLDVGLATQAFRIGASGYVLKQSAGEELVMAIRAALNGQTYITPRIANEVLQNLMSGGGTEAGPQLTQREREVLQLLAEGKTLKEAAGVLGVSPRTVEFHRNNISEKTGLKTMAELARYAARCGLVQEAQ